MPTGIYKRMIGINCGKGINPGSTGKHWELSEEVRDKISKNNGTKNPKVRLKMNKAKLGIPLSEEHKKNIGKKNKISMLGNKNGQRNKGKIRTAEHKRKYREASTKLWQNLEYQEKTIKAILKANYIKPNKSEIFLIKLFNELLPNEYKYVGDGEFVLGRKCPDFINVQGQKKLIEYNSNYWHSEEVTGETREIHEQKRITHFKQFGFDTLIIWENELKNLNKVKNKILEFTKS